MKTTINLYNQWKELSKNYNWRTINLINIEYEWDKVGHDGHIDFTLFGFSLYIHFVNDKYWDEKEWNYRGDYELLYPRPES